MFRYFTFVFIRKYLLTAGLREQAFNVTQSWTGILKFSLRRRYMSLSTECVAALLSFRYPSYLL